MFWKNREPPALSAWEQMEIAKQQARSEIAGEFLAVCVKMDQKVLESYIDYEAAKGKAFTGSASEVFFTDLSKILFAFVRANGSATEGLGDIFYLIAPLLSSGVSAMTSSTIAVHYLNQLSVDQTDDEPSIPQSLYCLKLFDEKYRTSHASQAVQVYLKLVSVACEQGISRFAQANRVVKSRYIELLNSFGESLSVQATARTPEETALVNAFQDVAHDGASLACRLYRQEAGSDDSIDLNPERLLIMDVLHVISSVARATSEAISEHHGRLLLLIGQKIDPDTFKAYSLKISVKLIVQMTEEPAKALWEPVILKVLTHHDEQNSSNASELPRRAFELLVSAAAHLSSNPVRREQVISQYSALLKAISGETGQTADAGNASEAYEILGVVPACTDKELNVAYHKKTAHWHPDKFHAMDIPKEMKEMATREMARVNVAYKLLEKLRAAPAASKLNATQTEPAADGPKRDDPRADAKPKGVPPPKTNDSSFHAPECGNDGEAFIKDREDEHDMTGRPVGSEQEKFYKTVNRVVDEHSTEISLGLAYGKYRFWKAIFASKFGQVVLMLILMGLFWLFGSHKYTQQQAPVPEVQAPIQPSPPPEPVPDKVSSPIPTEMAPASDTTSDIEAAPADPINSDEGKNTNEAAFTDAGDPYYKAGIGGVSYPVCVYCPNPKYNDEARKAKYEGTIVLQAIIAADGSVSDVEDVKGPGLGLNEVAIQTVKNWKFTPAVGPDGKPVAVMVPVQITFRFVN